MRLLAIDQASLSGWSFFIDDKLIDKGLIDIKKHEYPLASFRAEIVFLIYKHNPDVIVFEDLVSMRNAKSVRKLQRITGVLEEVSQFYNIKYFEYPTVSVRSKLCPIKTGEKGRATKFDLARVVCNKYNMEYPLKKNGEEVTDPQAEFFNLSDSVGLAMYHLRYGK